MSSDVFVNLTEVFGNVRDVFRKLPENLRGSYENLCKSSGNLRKVLKKVLKDFWRISDMHPPNLGRSHK